MGNRIEQIREMVRHRAERDASPKCWVNAGPRLQVDGMFFPRGSVLPGDAPSWKNFEALAQSWPLKERLAADVAGAPQPYPVEQSPPRRQPLVLPSKLSQPHDLVDVLRASVEAELRNGAESIAAACDRSRLRNAEIWSRAQRVAADRRAGGKVIGRVPLSDIELLGA